MAFWAAALPIIKAAAPYIAAGASSLIGLKGQKDAKKQFNEQMDSSISRRVDDAKRAGIHPLFALGSSAGASPTLSSGGGLGDTARSIEKLGRLPQQQSQAAQSKALAAAAIRRDESAAALDDARAAIARQTFDSRGRDGISKAPGVKIYGYDEAQPGGEVAFGPQEFFNPQVATSKRVGVESGTHPGTVDAILPDGRTVNIPSQNLGLDEVAQIDYVYQRAVHKGADAMMAVHNYLKGMYPTGLTWKGKRRSLKGPKHVTYRKK